MSLVTFHFLNEMLNHYFEVEQTLESLNVEELFNLRDDLGADMAAVLPWTEILKRQVRNIRPENRQLITQCFNIISRLSMIVDQILEDVGVELDYDACNKEECTS